MKRLIDANIGTKIYVEKRKVPYIVEARSERYLVAIGKRFNEPAHIVFDLKKRIFGVAISYDKKEILTKSDLPLFILDALETNLISVIKKYSREIKKVTLIIKKEENKNE